MKFASEKIRMIVLTGLLFAIALILSLIENALPPVPIPFPGVKFGLSNIAVMYALFFVGKSQAFYIAVLKAGFVMLTRGVVAGFLSLFGGILSLVVMIILLFVFKEKISYLILSVSGAVFHNIGQFIAISIIYTSMGLWAYFPILIIAGVVAGIVTAILLRVIMPALKKIG